MNTKTFLIGLLAMTTACSTHQASVANYEDAEVLRCVDGYRYYEFSQIRKGRIPLVYIAMEEDGKQVRCGS